MPPSLISFLLACLVIELTPGPNMAYLASLSSVSGRRAGFAMVAGISAGLLTIGIASALGAAALVSESRVAYQALRWLGTLYFAWLAWDIWRDEAAGAAEDAGVRYFRRGFITNALSPKSFVFYVTVFPDFIDPSRPPLVQFLALTVVYVCIATAVHSLIALAGAALRPFLDNPRKIKATRRFFSVLLLGMAVWLAWSTRR